MEKKKKDILLISLLLVVFIALMITGIVRIVKNLNGESSWTEQIDALPVLTTDKEISAAIVGEPKDYLVENYVFKKGETVADTLTEFLSGKYLYIKVLREVRVTKRHSSGSSRNKQSYDSYWEVDAARSIRGQLYLCGTELENIDSAYFFFGVTDPSAIPEEDVKPDMVEDFYFQGHYYPHGALNVDSIKADIKRSLTLDKITEFNSKVQTKHGYKGTIRFGYQVMKRGDHATFAVRLGDGRADLKVFDEGNVIAVNGDKGDLKKSAVSFFSILKVILWGLFSFFFFIMSFVAVLSIKSELKKKKDGNAADAAETASQPEPTEEDDVSESKTRSKTKGSKQ